MNDVVVCDKELNEVMDAETVAAITFNHTHGSLGSWDRPERFIPNAPPYKEGDTYGQNLRERIDVHNTHYEQIKQQEFPQESNMEHNELLRSVSYHVAMDDLPDTGDKNVLYKIKSTGDLFVWMEDQYCPYNPYAAEGEQVAAPRVMIEDDSAFMPSGGKGPLAIIYNIHALRRDLVLKQLMNWDWTDMIPANMASQVAKTDPDRQTKLRNLYFRTSHKALLDQLRLYLRTRGEFRKEYVDALNRVGVDVWFTDNQYGLKDGDFVVNFA